MRAAAAACGCPMGAPMTFAQADGGAVNPGHGHENCAACVAVYQLRRRGLDIAAAQYDHTPNSASFRLGEETRLIWRTANGHLPVWCSVLNSDSTTLARDLDLVTLPSNSRYHISYDYQDRDDGHILTAERSSQGLVIYHPQTNRIESLGGLAVSFKKGGKLHILRVDRLLVDCELLPLVALAAM